MRIALAVGAARQPKRHAHDHAEACRLIEPCLSDRHAGVLWMGTHAAEAGGMPGGVLASAGGTAPDGVNWFVLSALHAATCSGSGIRRGFDAAARASSSKVARPADDRRDQCSGGMRFRWAHDRQVWMDAPVIELSFSAVPAPEQISECVLIR